MNLGIWYDSVFGFSTLAYRDALVSNAGVVEHRTNMGDVTEAQQLYQPPTIALNLAEVIVDQVAVYII